MSATASSSQTDSPAAEARPLGGDGPGPGGSDAGSDTTLAPSVPRWLGRAAGTIFGTVAAVRNKRGLHPRGVTLAGAAQVHEAGSLLSGRDDPEVVVRLSRGAGLPHPLPDFAGIAVRLVDAHGRGRHQDLLLASAGRFPVLRHVLVPVPSLHRIGYSSILPYRTPMGRRIFRAEPLPVPSLQAAADAGRLTIEIKVGPLLGSWEPALTVVLDRTLDPEEAASVRFDPWNTTPDMVPAGLLNRLRHPAYAASREAAPHVP